jgi:exo-beta-1,3-glucanase (GH17 family)
MKEGGKNMNTMDKWISALMFLFMLVQPGFSGAESRNGLIPPTTDQELRAAAPLRCVAFSPYVSGYNPDQGLHPPAALIDTLLDVIQRQAGFQCILTYGFLNSLNYVMDAAHARGMKVIAAVWLEDTEGNPSRNEASINAGIAKALQYPGTIIRMSCGVELRNRLGAAKAEPIIQDCLTRLRSAGVTQPLTSIDTWWHWCNESWPCQTRGLASQMDWIGVNVYPWWENKYSPLFPCTPAEEAAAFHRARVENVQATYPSKPVWLTEFGWPAGPEGYTEINLHTGQRCGVAGEANQRRVIEETLKLLEPAGIQSVVFEAFREPRKAGEGPVGPYWGFCEGVAPYPCHGGYGFTNRVHLPLLLNN